jgi:DNA-binding NarL/FixJ family response regulator
VSPCDSKPGFETSAPGAGEAMPQRNRPRVLLADDDAQVGVAVSRLLSFSCDVIGCVRDVDTLLDSVMQLRPDVVLLDFSLQGRVNALEACRLLQATAPQVSIVAFTADNDPEIRRAAYEAGASGFVWKMQVATDLLPAIQAAVDGRSRLSKGNSV